MNNEVIEKALGGSKNIMKRMEKEGLVQYMVKDPSLIDKTQLENALSGSQIQIERNRIRISQTARQPLDRKEEQTVPIMAKKERKYEQLSKDIIEKVGGKANIKSLRHCITRVRFVLKDESIADDKALENMEGVISVVKKGGEYMVVIGTHVEAVYDEIIRQLGDLEETNEKSEETGEKKNVFMRCLNSVMAAVAPALNLICAGGVIKGILAIAGMFGLAADSGVYMLLNAMGDGIFYFLPVFLGFNMAKNMGIPGLMGALIGCTMLYPTINGVDINLFGYVMNASYTSSFLPVVLVTACAVPVYKWLDERIPSVVKGFLVPTLTMLLIFPIGFALIGPAANWAGNQVNTIITALMNTVPLIGGALFAGLYQVLVLFGIHSAVTSFSFMNVLSGNPDVIMALSCYASFAQIGVVLAMYLKSKDQKVKSVALPAFISGIFGVTEPAIYGVTLPDFKMFVISCIGAAIGGAVIMMTNTIMYSFTGLGVVTLIGMLNPEAPDIFSVILCAIVPFVASFIMAWVAYKPSAAQNKTETAPKADAKKEATVIEPVMSGKIIPLSEVNDPTFSAGLLGHGFAIEPDDGKIYAPFDGEVMMVFGTRHAIGLKSESGAEVLIHCGLETVNLEGKPFTVHVQAGDKVKKGQLLMEADLNMIKEAGLQTVTPVIVTNESEVGQALFENNRLVIA